MERNSHSMLQYFYLIYVNEVCKGFPLNSRLRIEADAKVYLTCSIADDFPRLFHNEYDNYPHLFQEVLITNICESNIISAESDN